MDWISWMKFKSCQVTELYGLIQITTLTKSLLPLPNYRSMRNKCRSTNKIHKFDPTYSCASVDFLNRRKNNREPPLSALEAFNFFSRYFASFTSMEFAALLPLIANTLPDSTANCKWRLTVACVTQHNGIFGFWCWCFRGCFGGLCFWVWVTGVNLAYQSSA